MTKIYERINFENSPSIRTPLSAENLNKMDAAIDLLDTKVSELTDGGSGGEYLEKENPTGMGSFSLNRKQGTVVGDNSFACGINTEASGKYSFSCGGYTKAIVSYSVAEGQSSQSVGQAAHSEGFETIAEDFAHAEGWQTHARQYQHVIGHNNDITTGGIGCVSGPGNGTQSAFVIGNGVMAIENSNGDILVPKKPSNAFRVTYLGQIYAKSATISEGADYAEYFEWSDGNIKEEDRVGRFVTFDFTKNSKIKIANDGDYILGIVSGCPSVIGNGDECWKKRFITDEFGRKISEELEYTRKVLNEDGEEETITEKCNTWKTNPEYDESMGYKQREQRKEWDAVGMLGVLSVYDDGSCNVGGYCKCGYNGIATISYSRGYDTFMVIERITDNIIKVVLK